MRRKIALILSVFMLVTLLLPVQTLAADDKGLENAIKVAKEKFTVPADYKFDYSMGNENGRTVWYLNWNSQDGNGGNINVRVDEKGTILGYYSWKPTDYPQQKKLPKLSKQEAKDKAEAFIKKIQSDILSRVKYQEADQYYYNDYAYYFIYARMENGIPYYSNYVNVEINRQTGEIQSYNYVWDDSLTFPAPDKKIDLAAAEKAYIEKMGLKLEYKYTMEDEKVKIFAAYVPKYDNYRYAIDALTGEKIQIEYGYYGPYYDGNAAESKMEMSRAGGMGGEVPLTPDEIKAVEEASKLMDVKEAEKIARNFKYLGLTDDFRLNYSNVSRSWPLRDEFIWYLDFVKEATAKDSNYYNVGLSIDAKTGEIKSFYTGAPYKEGETAKYDEAAAKTAVENFLKEFKPEIFKQTEFDTNGYDPRVMYAGSEAPRWYNFRYTRIVNGIPFSDNGLYVDFDAVNGKITSFNMNWFNMEFPAVANAVEVDKVYDTLFKDVGLELVYKPTYPQNGDAKPLIYPQSQGKPDVKLVYALKSGKPLLFDANSGVMLDYNGKPYKESRPVAYTDIKDHFAEQQILVLAENGISLEGTEFRPDEAIIQKDFFTLLSKTLSSYYGPVITKDSSDKDIDNLYNFLMREGVVKEGEKAPNAALTREDGVKFIIRALKYDKVADIKDIYKPIFKDTDKINPDLVGYVTIASGLKIVSGYDGNFNPKGGLTRAGAAVMIYNYMQR